MRLRVVLGKFWGIHLSLTVVHLSLPFGNYQNIALFLFCGNWISSTADCGSLKAHSPSMQEQEPAGICDEMHLAPITFCFYQEKQARFSQGGSPCRWIDMGELIDSGVGGKVDPWTNEDGPDFPLDTSGPRQACFCSWAAPLNDLSHVYILLCGFCGRKHDFLLRSLRLGLRWM
eukprot:g51847.t1